MDPIAAPFEKDFGVIAERVRAHAKRDPKHLALVDKTASVTYAQLDAMMDRVAAALKRDGITPQQAIAICAYSSVHYAAIFLGALRAGVVVAPLAPGSTPEQLQGMLTDADAKILFTEEATGEAVKAAEALGIKRVSLDGSPVGQQLKDWVAPAGTTFKEVKPKPDWAFNIIYSSGTTGTPKGIVQPHKMRWAHVRRGGGAYQYGPGGVTILATPLYSNTTLVVFFPTIAWGGTVVLMPKFDAKGYLELAQKHRVTHTMLVPVQYSRIMAVPEFDSFDLSSFKFKFCTSAPFGAALKADILKRWPGGLVEFYGMTEGGGSCILEAHTYPNKLHTVGKPAEGHDIRLIDEHGKVVPQGEMGEVVGRSVSMMTGYHQQPGKTRDAEWYSPEGERFIRTGDVGRFDEDGFLTLMDRKKDMIISGGFNIYPSDLEAVMRQHAAVADVAVVGVPSEAWGETPVAYVVKKPGEPITEQALQDWFAHQVGKTQRVSAVHYIDELPRSAIGKVLKRELRDKHVAESKPHIVA
jgi:acyl-CoA synthetase (AMP-forming)/AMP-acid ligase II